MPVFRVVVGAVIALAIFCLALGPLAFGGYLVITSKYDLHTIFSITVVAYVGAGIPAVVLLALMSDLIGSEPENKGENESEEKKD